MLQTKKKKILLLTEILEVIETSNIRLVTLWSTENRTGTLLVLQWLRIHLPTQGALVPSLVGELTSHMPWSK